MTKKDTPSKSGRRKSTGPNPASERRESSARRKTQPKDDKELYKLPASDIEDFITKERRHDELDRIREVQEQKRVWRNIVYYSVFINICFLGLAIFGAFND